MSEMRKYDFSTKKMYSKDQLKAFEFISTKMSKIIGSALSEELNNNVLVSLKEIEQLTYEEFINSISTRTLYIPYVQGDIKNTNLLYVNAELAFIAMDILMGGDGNYCDIDKDITELDKKIFKYIVTLIIESLTKFMKSSEKSNVDFTLGSIEESYIAKQNIYLDEIIVVSKFNVKIKGRECELGICTPYSGKKNNVLEIEQWIKEEDPDYSKLAYQGENNIKENLNCVELDLVGELGKTSITIGEFLDLSEGDILRLDSKVSEPIKVSIEDIYMYYGKPGTILGRNGVLILSLIEKWVNNNA